MVHKLDQVYAGVQSELLKVEEQLRLLTADGMPGISSALDGIIHAGGKRLRPALLLTASKACGYSGERAINLAVAVELVHTASLIHDDVIDDAPTRRGMPTINRRWGTKTAVLAGDYVYSKVIQLMAENANEEIMQCMASTACTMTNSELVESLARHDVSLSEEKYLSIISGKTASLLSCCCRVGALLGERCDGEADILDGYGRDLGMAFQIGDDLLDIMGDEDKLGKPVGSDVREGVLTLPVIHSIEQGDEETRETIRMCLESVHADTSAFDKIRQIVDKYGGIDYSMQKAREYGEACKEKLLALRKSESRNALMILADYVMERTCRA